MVGLILVGIHSSPIRPVDEKDRTAAFKPLVRQVPQNKSVWIQGRGTNSCLRARPDVLPLHHPAIISE